MGRRGVPVAAEAIRVYLKTPNAPGQRTFSRCAAPFFLEIRQYSCEKMSCSAQKFLAAGHIGSFQIHPREFFAYYISLVNIVPEDREPDESGRFFERKGLIKLLTAMLAESHIGYNLINADGEYFVFPKGAVELDSTLVSQPLAWLNQYPTAHTAFVKALREYADATTENASDIAD